MQCKNCGSDNTRLLNDDVYINYNVYLCDTCGDSFKVDRDAEAFYTNIRPTEMVLNIIDENLGKEPKLGGFSVDSDESIKKQELIKFFIWFRDNGEKHIGLTIEELIEEYLK